MAQRLLKHTLFYSKNSYTIKNQYLLLKPSPVIQNPVIRSCSSKAHVNPDLTKLTKSVTSSCHDYVNESYKSGGKILRDFINTIEIIIYENNAKLSGDPIVITNKFTNFDSNSYSIRLDDFRSNGIYITSTFGKDIEKHLKSCFPDLKIAFSFEGKDKEYTITITNYINRDIILKHSGI
ncbi:hypothetical protein C1645_828728 [Glomus cerebriforme]|uniref:Uncharacterized protein n=1 Tax=Glomus cerebriforme TaxID=658196 RepID=A0A397SQB0_9GLOM|nr:hypothetical protein C1645_828728 [Glomus cerebriforme]